MPSDTDRYIGIKDDVNNVFVGAVPSSKYKEMCKWCNEQCKRDGDNKSQWGTSWWTMNGGTVFCFADEIDAMAFRLRYG